MPGYSPIPQMCPICGEENAIKAVVFPAHREEKVGRGSGQRGRIVIRVPEKLTVTSDCSNCSKNKSIIQRYLDGKLTLEEAKAGKKKKKCKYCKEPFEGKGSMCAQCAEWED